MRVKFRVAQSNGVEWNEWTSDFDEKEDPRLYALKLIDRYNKSCTKREPKRELICVISFRRTLQRKLHDWQKLSLVTEVGGFDQMKCSKCTITGRRYGLGQQGVNRESKYKADIYRKCNSAIDHLKKKG